MKLYDESPNGNKNTYITKGRNNDGDTASREGFKRVDIPILQVSSLFREFTPKLKSSLDTYFI